MQFWVLYLSTPPPPPLSLSIYKSLDVVLDCWRWHTNGQQSPGSVRAAVTLQLRYKKPFTCGSRSTEQPEQASPLALH